MPTIRAFAAAALAAACVLLSSCVLLPGKFGSELTVRADGNFAFTYKGDIHLVALSKFAEEAKGSATEEPFAPTTCYADNGEERACTKEELATQRSDWEESRKSSAEKKQQDAEMMKAMLGGIDPSDPRAAEEFASRLRRQAGWRSVIDRGNGRFEVEFAATGRLNHDFTFPTLERMPVVSPFVTVIRRSDGTVRIEAPGFAASSASSLPMMGMAEAMTKSGTGPDSLPALDGTFAVITDGEVLANNTDDGPQAASHGRRLSWKVNARTTAAPTALIRLQQ